MNTKAPLPVFEGDSCPGIYFLHVYAKPKSHQDKIEGWMLAEEKHVLQVRIKALPEGGKANKAIIDLLARTLAMPKSYIHLVSGSTLRHKIFKITPWSNSLGEKLPKYAPLPTLF
ncbi:DUF167 family protein [Cardinium endosymbiont of Tipula unca]|uniref:DUF167 domain-containing protein n=1 Tax=Cardinium endosymbiont of Tipula unca TaxID=3066216 RepID=UPI0030CC6C1F